MVYTDSVISISLEKEQSSGTAYNMNRHRHHDADLDEQDTGQILHNSISSCMITNAQTENRPEGTGSWGRQCGGLFA